MKYLSKKWAELLLLTLLLVAVGVFYTAQNYWPRNYHNPDYRSFMENYHFCTTLEGGTQPESSVNFKNPDLYDLWKSGKGCQINPL